MSINTIWKTIVLIKDIAADTRPLFSAVKNEDAKMHNPEKKKENENTLKPCTVNSNSS